MKNPQAPAGLDYAELLGLTISSPKLSAAMANFFKTQEGQLIVKSSDKAILRAYMKIMIGYDPGPVITPDALKDLKIANIAASPEAPIETPENISFFGSDWPIARTKIAQRMEVLCRKFDSPLGQNTDPDYINFILSGSWAIIPEFSPPLPAHLPFIPPLAFWTDQAIADFVSSQWKLKEPRTRGSIEQWRRRLELKKAAVILIQKWHVNAKGVLTAS